jgi:predicted phosphodiesterase
MEKHILQNLMWGDTHFKICNGETYFNIQKEETNISEFKMERRASIFIWGDTCFKI